MYAVASSVLPIDPEETQDRAPSLLNFPVVGIGASAGGVHVLQRFFENTPNHTGMAFVVVLHLSPQHESSLDKILQKTTRMPVLEVKQTVAIEPDHVYVISPSLHLEMIDGQLQVSASARPIGRHVSIDLFFRSLGQTHRERSFGVVLSGTGSDGAVGLARIKEHGGVTLVQSPTDAEYDGMPLSAIATGLADFVLPAVEIPQKLFDLWQNAQSIQLPVDDKDAIKANKPSSPVTAEQTEDALRDIMKLLCQRTGHDFKHYKRATVLRRIERRMQVNSVPTLPVYRSFLEGSPEEARLLLKDMLISVTNFFRDREAFDALAQEVIAPLFDSRPIEQLRVWVPGCATGEEAYSIAILLTEHAAKKVQPLDLQVFATDIDERAIATGRAGVYPASIAADVPPARLRDFFTHEEGRYRVRKSLREKILFAVNNVMRDPPFSKLDLICCRNLMIYLDREAQARILETFHFALQPGGYLFLGTSETADMASSLFSIVDKKNRIYRANLSSRASRGVPSALFHEFDARRNMAPPVSPSVSPQTELHRRVVAEFSPPSVLIDGDGNIVHVSERATSYLRYAGGPPSHHLVSLIQPELRMELRTALFHAGQTGCSVEARRVRTERGGKTLYINISVRPVFDTTTGGRFMLVVFNEVEATLSPDGQQIGLDKDPIVVELEAELQRTKEQLLGTIGQSETSTEELRASNEELQAINEELRSATEELETSKEELQSVNEELITVNHELKLKVEETGRINDDLQNLIGATDIATIFVDGGMRIKRFTPKAAQVFNIIPADVGRSLLDITHRLQYEQLAHDVEEVFNSLRVIEREVAGAKNQWYLARLVPYRTVENRIDGAVLNFIDISARRHAEEQLQAREAHTRLVAESTKDYAIITFDKEGLVTTWNLGAARLFGYSEAEMTGKPTDIIFTPEDRALGRPEEELRRAREQGRAEDERWHLRKDGSRFYCSGVVTPLMDGSLHGYAKIARDLTEQKMFEAEREALLNREKTIRSQLQEANRSKDEFLAVMSHELKNPLNLIAVNVELLARLPQARDIPAVVRATDIIRRTVRSQAQIIDDLLDLSRMNMGKFRLSPSSVLLTTIVSRIVDAVRVEAETKELSIHQFMTDGEPPVFADPVRVEQIVWNLISNAIKFTPNGGSITLHLSRDGEFMRFDVADTGQGIAPDSVSGIFDMFRQIEGATTRQQGGLGIGLALVKHLAELHGGKVGVHSKGIGQGATFSVWLPVDDQGPGSRLSSASLSTVSGLRILLVDDDASTLETFGLLLQLEGAHLVTAANSHEALERVEMQNFDLIISDIGMPGMDGYALIQALRNRERTRTLPAIAVTGFGKVKDETQSLAAGFSAHLTKPVRMDALMQAIQGIVGQAEPRG